MPGPPSSASSAPPSTPKAAPSPGASPRSTATGAAEETYTLDPADFAQMPGSPFTYWIGESIRRLFVELLRAESEGRAARPGDHPENQDRYLRLFWGSRS